MKNHWLEKRKSEFRREFVNAYYSIPSDYIRSEEKINILWKEIRRTNAYWAANGEKYEEQTPTGLLTKNII